MSDEPKSGLEKLREPFPENQISKLPKPTAKREVMANLPKAKCEECGGYHATRNIIHLDYVGHAAATDRLLDTDLEWTWEPLSVDERGLPAFDRNGGLWIKLTVLGVSRLGYGSADGKTGGDAIKEIIGDAIRNAGMRFGMALDLWHKGDLHLTEEDEAPAKPKPAKEQEPEFISSEDVEHALKLCEEVGNNQAQVICKAYKIKTLSQLTKKDGINAIKRLNEIIAAKKEQAE